jgi:hypothetical protein
VTGRRGALPTPPSENDTSAGRAAPHILSKPMPPSDGHDPATPSSRAVPWSSLAVRTFGRFASAGRDVMGPQRLALLYLWYRDGSQPRFGAAQVGFHPPYGPALTSPRVVDWSGFPWADAVAAVSDRDRRHRLPTPLSLKPRG